MSEGITGIGGATVLSGPLPPGTSVIGHVIVDSAGNVGITSLPALAAGTNVIGHVVVDSEPTADALLTAISGKLPAALGGHGGIVIEGVASGTAVPVSSITLAQDATLTGGTATTIVRGGAKGSTSAATVTSHDTSQSAVQPLDTEEALAPVAEDNTTGVIVGMQADKLTATYSRGEIGLAMASNAFNLRASAGQVNALQLVNRNSSQRIFGLVNKATTPTNGDTIVRHVIVPGSTTLDFASDMLGASGVYLATGVSGAWSTTTGTVTLATAGDHDAVVWGV